jgi:hypothetical protein
MPKSKKKKFCKIGPRWPFVAPTPTGDDAGVQGICHDIYGTDGSQEPHSQQFFFIKMGSIR